MILIRFDGLVNLSTSQHITAHHSTSQHITAHHSTSQHITAHHSTSQHITAHHSTSQHITAHHSTSQHITAHHSTSQHHTIRLRVMGYHLWITSAVLIDYVVGFPENLILIDLQQVRLSLSVTQESFGSLLADS